MNVRFLMAALAVALSLGPSMAFAEFDAALLSPAQKRAYHTCLYASYTENFCRFNSWGSSYGAFRECMIANRAGRVPPGVPFWSWGVENTCRALVQTESR